MKPIFIKFRGDTINITKVVDCSYNEERKQTQICYDTGEGLWGYYEGDCRDEFWKLVKLAMEPKDAEPEIVDRTWHTEIIGRIEGIEARIGDAVDAQKQQMEKESTLHSAKKHRTIIGYDHAGVAVYKEPR